VQAIVELNVGLNRQMDNLMRGHDGVGMLSEQQARQRSAGKVYKVFPVHKGSNINRTTSI
jgi:hypothetical protein